MTQDVCSYNFFQTHVECCVPYNINTAKLSQEPLGLMGARPLSAIAVLVSLTFQSTVVRSPKHSVSAKPWTPVLTNVYFNSGCGCYCRKLLSRRTSLKTQHVKGKSEFIFSSAEHGEKQQNEQTNRNGVVEQKTYRACGFLDGVSVTAHILECWDPSSVRTLFFFSLNFMFSRLSAQPSCNIDYTRFWCESRKFLFWLVHYKWMFIA